MGSLMKKTDTQIEGVLLTPLKTIDVAGGDVRHAMKRNDPGYVGFGEAYFSIVKTGVVKAWKRHKLMTLNLVVCSGKIRFVIYDDRQDLSSEDSLKIFKLSATLHTKGSKLSSHLLHTSRIQ